MKQFARYLLILTLGLFQSTIGKSQYNIECLINANCIHYAIENENLVNCGYYDYNYLSTNIIGEERIIIEFSDLAERLVLRREIVDEMLMDTYFVYDEHGNLRCVLPPLVSGSEITEEKLKNYAFIYSYDNYNRLIAKKLPGFQWYYYVYDESSQLIDSCGGEKIDVDFDCSEKIKFFQLGKYYDKKLDIIKGYDYGARYYDPVIR